MSCAFALTDVAVVYISGPRRFVALRDVSLEVAPGEFVGIYGRRLSGRSTLLHVVAGIVTPSQGDVSVGGVCLDRRGDRPSEPRAVLCQPGACDSAVETVEQVAAVLLASRVGYTQARQRAHELLGRTGAAGAAGLTGHKLDGEQLMRVALAKALAADPLVVLCDEPTLGLDFVGRDRILTLLRSVATDDRIAVVITAGEIACIAGVDRALRLAEGRLRGEAVPRTAAVHELPGAAAGESV